MFRYHQDTIALLKDRDLIVQELVDTAVFSAVNNRHYESFQHVKLQLKSTDREELLSWMLEHMHIYSSIHQITMKLLHAV